MSLTNLPSDITLYVIPFYLKPQDLANYAITCKLFHCLMYDKDIWLMHLPGYEGKHPRQVCQALDHDNKLDRDRFIRVLNKQDHYFRQLVSGLHLYTDKMSIISGSRYCFNSHSRTSNLKYSMCLSKIKNYYLKIMFSDPLQTYEIKFNKDGLDPKGTYDFIVLYKHCVE